MEDTICMRQEKSHFGVTLDILIEEQTLTILKNYRFLRKSLKHIASRCLLVVVYSGHRLVC